MVNGCIRGACGRVQRYCKKSMFKTQNTVFNTTETLLTHTLFQRTLRWSPTSVSLVYDERSVRGRRTLRSRVRERTICTYGRKMLPLQPYVADCRDTHGRGRVVFSARNGGRLRAVLHRAQRSHG